MEISIIVIFASVLFLIGILLILVLNKNRLSLMSNIDDLIILNFEEAERDANQDNTKNRQNDFEKYVSTVLETLLKSQKEILQNTLDLNIQYNLKQGGLQIDQFTKQELNDISSNLEFKAKKTIELLSQIEEKVQKKKATNLDPEETKQIDLAMEEEMPIKTIQQAVLDFPIDDEEQKRRAEERIHKLRNLSYNQNTLDAENEFENVPAYVRRNLELFRNNKLTAVEDFYSKVSVKKDENGQTQISTINTFLDGKKPE